MAALHQQQHMDQICNVQWNKRSIMSGRVNISGVIVERVLLCSQLFKDLSVTSYLAFPVIQYNI